MTKEIIDAGFIFDPDYVASDPTKAGFYEEIRRTVDEITDRYPNIDNMTDAQREGLRAELLGVKITLTSEGEIVHEMIKEESL